MRLALALALALATLPACGGPPPAAPAKRHEVVPMWADVFEGVPDIYGVIRPKALKRDGLYGSFWVSLVRMAQARGIAKGGTMLDAVEGADEIIVGLGKGDAALVLRGVPASLDPQTIADASGEPLFRLLNDRAKIPEYELVDRRMAGGGAVFVLPDRTWVGALGEARARARQAFAAPLARPAPEVDPEALVVVRFGGGFPRMFDRHPLWGRLAKGLTSATFSLKPKKGGLVVALAYDDAGAVAFAEMQAKQIAEELARDDKRLTWLKDAKIAYEGNTVFVRAPVPPRLLEELPAATGADLGL